MTTSYRQSLIAAAVLGALSLTSAHAQTPDSVDTRIGTLKFEQGSPTEEAQGLRRDRLAAGRASLPVGLFGGFDVRAEPLPALSPGRPAPGTGERGDTGRAI